jgi:uncharacterized membrane protein YphA (DoxX/SURF4 family)
MRRARALDAFVVWAISIALAGVFVVVGVPKLLGIGTVGLQAAAMRGFPPWVRVLVGLVETLGGIALLVPRMATMAALVLAVAMVPATFTQQLSGEPGMAIPLTILALLLFVAWRRNAPAISDGYHGFRASPHPKLYEGVLAGVIGATAIAVWFLVIDSIAGRPFFTPTTLGRGLLNALGFGPEDYGTLTNVLVYTAFHYAAFMVVGLTASLVVYLARQHPPVLFGFLLLFAVTEVGIYILVSILDVGSPLGRHAWLNIMAGNLIAAVAMGTFFWRRHQEIREEFRHSLDWEVPDRTDDGQTVAEPLGMAATYRTDATLHAGPDGSRNSGAHL